MIPFQPVPSLRGRKRVVITPGSKPFKRAIRGGLTPSTMQRLQQESSSEEDEEEEEDDDDEAGAANESDDEEDVRMPITTPGKKRRKRLRTELEKVRY